MMMWLVTVKAPGIMPTRFATRTKRKREKTKGKKAHALLARHLAQHVRHEFVDRLGQALPAVGHQQRTARSQHQAARDEGDDQDHVQTGIGQGDRRITDHAKTDDLGDLELFDRARHRLRILVLAAQAQPCA